MYYYICKNLVWIFFHIAFSIRYENRENIPKDSTVIYAANHRTNADPPLVGSGARGRCVFMAKEELFQGEYHFQMAYSGIGRIPRITRKGRFGNAGYGC